MLVCDNGDAIRGIAEVATKLDFIVNGYVGVVATQLADGQLGTSEADLYLSGADATVVTSITIVNTDSAARTFTLYLKPSGGTSRAISPISLDLGIGHSFYTDGQRVVVLDKSGNVLSTATVLAHDLGGASHIADTLSNLNSKISDATLVDTDSIILKALLTTQNDIITRNGSNPIRLNIGASKIVARLAAGNLVAATGAQIIALLSGANLDVGAYNVRGATLTADGLTSGRVVFAGASGVLSDDSDFLFAVDTLTVTKIGAFELAGTLALGGQVIDTGAGTMFSSSIEGGKIIWKDVSAVELTRSNQTSTTTWTGLDLTATTSSIAKFAILRLQVGLDSYTSGRVYIGVRKNGTTPTHYPILEHVGTSTGRYTYAIVIVGLDGSQILQYEIQITGTAQIDVAIGVLGYIE